MLTTSTPSFHWKGLISGGQRALYGVISPIPSPHRAPNRLQASMERSVERRAVRINATAPITSSNFHILSRRFECMGPSASRAVVPGSPTRNNLLIRSEGTK
jgi:hypothetical protein